MKYLLNSLAGSDEFGGDLQAAHYTARYFTQHCATVTKQSVANAMIICTICPRSSDPLNIVSYFIKLLLLGQRVLVTKLF